MSNHDFPELRPNPRVRTNTHEPRSFFPAQSKFQLAFFQCSSYIFLFGKPGTRVPNHYGSASIFTFRNDAFKITVLQWMVFHLHREPFYGRIERRAFWNCPGQQDAIEFETKVVMQLRSAMFLHDIPQRLVSPALRVTVGLR